MEEKDPTKYRVTLICACDADLVYGYGATIPEADKVARAEFKKHNPRARWKHRYVDHAVTHSGGGSHYEEYEA